MKIQASRIRHNPVTALYSLYKGAPINPVERLVIYLRLRLSSYEIIESHVPASGKILDLGCGFGMLTLYLALCSQTRRVKGIDISNRRLRTAEFVSANIRNVTFESGDLLQCAIEEPDCILLIDSLHYFPILVQNQLLEKCHGHIKPGGKLLVRDSNADKRFRHLITTFHETIMTKSGFTHGDVLCFRSLVELRSHLERLGFMVDVLPMWQKTPFADTLLVCKKADA